MRGVFIMSEERQIKFNYIFPENYNPVYCNGAFGGVSTQGEIIANFFLERPPVPNSVTNSINSDGTLGGIVEVDPQNINDTIIRYISTGIVLNEENARAVYEWLGNQIQELENRKAMGYPISKEGE